MGRIAILLIKESIDFRAGLQPRHPVLGLEPISVPGRKSGPGYGDCSQSCHWRKFMVAKSYWRSPGHGGRTPENSSFDIIPFPSNEINWSSFKVI